MCMCVYISCVAECMCVYVHGERLMLVSSSIVLHLIVCNCPPTPSKLEHTDWLDWLAWSMKDVPVLSPSPVLTDQCMLPCLAFCGY